MCFQCSWLGHKCEQRVSHVVQKWIPKQNHTLKESSSLTPVVMPPLDNHEIDSDNGGGWIAATKVVRQQRPPPVRSI